MDVGKVFKSKEEQILHALGQRSLTAIDAFILYDDTCLNSTVSSLRRKGHNIEGIRKSFTNRYGKQGTVMSYKLIIPATKEEIETQKKH